MTSLKTQLTTEITTQTKLEQIFEPEPLTQATVSFDGGNLPVDREKSLQKENLAIVRLEPAALSLQQNESEVTVNFFMRQFNLTKTLTFCS